MKSQLAEIVIQNIEFLGLASDTEVHPDAAVRQLELISALLKELPEDELSDFFAHVEDRLKRLQSDGASQVQLDFLRGIREYLGV